LSLTKKYYTEIPDSNILIMGDETHTPQLDKIQTRIC